LEPIGRLFIFIRKGGHLIWAEKLAPYCKNHVIPHKHIELARCRIH